MAAVQVPMATSGQSRSMTAWTVATEATGSMGTKSPISIVELYSLVVEGHHRCCKRAPASARTLAATTREMMMSEDAPPSHAPTTAKTGTPTVVTAKATALRSSAVMRSAYYVVAASRVERWVCGYAGSMTEKRKVVLLVAGTLVIPCTGMLFARFLVPPDYVMPSFLGFMLLMALGAWQASRLQRRWGPASEALFSISTQWAVVAVAALLFTVRAVASAMDGNWSDTILAIAAMLGFMYLILLRGFGNHSPLLKKRPKSK